MIFRRAFSNRTDEDRQENTGIQSKSGALFNYLCINSFICSSTHTTNKRHADSKGTIDNWNLLMSLKHCRNHNNTK